MRRLFQKTARFAAAAFLSFCALFIFILIIAQAALIIGVNLLGSGRGTSFLEGKANEALAGSGYHVSFAGLYYDPVRGVSLYDLNVADDEGVFLSVDRFSLAVSLSQIALRDLEVFGRGGAVVWHRLPAGESSSEGMKPFSLPDLYFRTVSINHLSFQSVTIADGEAGKVFIVSPSLKGRIDLGEDMVFRLRLKPGMKDIAPGAPMPETITLDAGFAPETLYLSLRELSASSPAYNIRVEGTGGFADDGILDLRAAAHYDDLAEISRDNFEKADINLTLKGPHKAPALNAEGVIVPRALKERGLADIHVAMASSDVSQGMAGDISIDTSFREQPVAVRGILSYENDVLRFENLQGSAPHMVFEGAGEYRDFLTGAFKVSVDDLAHYKELLGYDIGGALSATALFAQAGNEQSAQASVIITKGSYEGISADRLSAEASLPTLAVPWPESARLEAAGLQIPDVAMLQSLTASVTKGDNESYALQLKANGSAPAPVSVSGSAILSNITQAVPAAQEINLSAKIGESAFTLTGDFSPDTVDLKLAVPDFHGHDIPASLSGLLENMRVKGTASMTGHPAAPRTVAEAAVTEIAAGDYKGAVMTLAARHEGTELNASLSGKGTGIRKLSSDVKMPLSFSLLPFHFAMDPQAALSGSIEADIDLAALSPIFLPPTQSLSGALVMNGVIAGTVPETSLSGKVRLSRGAYEDLVNGIALKDLAAEADLAANRLTLKNLSGTDGGQGRLAGKGTVSFGDRSGADITLNAQRFNIPKSNLANGVIDADLSLKGVQEDLKLSGKVDVAEMNILIPETFQSRIPELNIVESRTASHVKSGDMLGLDIKVNAPNQVFVRGWGLDAEFGGAIEISGKADAPQFNGTLSSRRGRFEEFGKRFALDRAQLRFQGEVPPSPYLDVKASVPAGDVTASILFTGSVQSPAIKFSSSPALPEDEVLSRILFGKDSATISPFQAVQLAQTIRRFSGEGGGGLDPLGMLRTMTGLDDISVEMGEDGGANVGVGKYLTDKVYLELEKGKTETSGAATIRIEVTPSINVESRTGQDAQTGGGIFWKRDY